MGKPQEFEIVVKDQTITNEGRTIEGQVVLDLLTPMEIEDLVLVFKGSAQCWWRDGNQFYSRKQKIVSLKKYLFRQVKKGDMHPNGRFIYLFAFETSLDLPRSISTNHGCINYWLKATVIRSGKSNFDVAVYVDIVEPIDTNLPEYLDNVTYTDSSNIGCCIPFGKLSLTVHLSRSAFCPGESIMINATANNQSGRLMRGLKARLIMITECDSGSKRKYGKCFLNSISGPPIPSGGIGMFVNEPLAIPAETGTTVINDVVSCYYNVRIKVRVPYDFDLKIDIRVVIGTVPFSGDSAVVKNATILTPLLCTSEAPEVPETEKTTDAHEKLGAHKVSKAHEASETHKVHEASVAPETHEASQASETPEASVAPEEHGASEASEEDEASALIKAVPCKYMQYKMGKIQKQYYEYLFATFVP
eukprot:gene20082-22052_t